MAILALFVVESGWIALSARYPMAFDEGYHLGLIKLFSHQWSPILLHQPPGPAALGPVTRYPSFLYHWLMSFPYRWLHLWLGEQVTVIALRFMNITFFAAGLVLFRRLLLKTKAQAGVVHVTFLFFVLVPIVPLLAGEINYDNLLMVILPLNLLMALRFRDELLKKRLHPGLLIATFSLALLGSLVVFPYLPILTAITVYLVYLLWKFAKLPRRKLGRDIGNAWRIIPQWRQIALVALLAVSVGLFIESYGVNLVRYRNITPSCDQVLGLERCMSYGPWARNYQYSLEPKPANASNDPLVFLAGWLQGMFLRSFFAINGPGDPDSYQNKPPLLLISITAVAVFTFGLFLVARRWRSILPHDPALEFLLFVSIVYIVSLVGVNYHGYLQFGRLLAINGRYLLLVILPIMLSIGIAYQQYLGERRQALLLAVVFLLFLQGGGALTFIYDSNSNWYWPNDRFALRINQDAQKAIHPFMLGKPRLGFW